MKILVAPNAFKGTLTANEAAEIIAEGLGEKYPDFEILSQPIADGGDGTCSLLLDSLGLEKFSIPSLNPIGQPCLGYFGLDRAGKKAYLDVSTASGISLLVKNQLRPDLASTFGTGLLVQKAIELGAEEIILGLGGSATIDLGTGILAALGIHFLDQNGRELTPFIPEYLSQIRHIQFSPRYSKIKFTLLCDVRNQFFGSNGAIPVFGPQKGLNSNEGSSFENHCHNFIRLFSQKKKESWKDQAGFGAAGGIGVGLSFVFPTEIRFGAAYFFQLVDLEKKIKEAAYIITGEGKYDSQSDQGKACFELLRLAKKHRKRTILITSGKEGFKSDFDQVLQLDDLDFSKSQLIEQARKNLKEIVHKIQIQD